MDKRTFLPLPSQVEDGDDDNDDDDDDAGDNGAGDDPDL